MINITFKPDRNFPRSVERHLSRMLGAAASAAVDALRTNITQGPRTGIHWSGYPRKSSAPGEYPQEQFSDLIRSTRVVRNSTLSYSVGFFGDKMEKLLKLEYGMLGVSDNQRMNPGYRRGQRKPLFMTLVGRDGKATRTAMNQAAESVA
jgi:hypothetical protein